MIRFRVIRTVVYASATLAAALAQTQIDLRNQSKAMDFSSAPSTKPFKTGAVLPATCSAGEMFFQTGAPAGANLYGCTGTNTWTAQAGGTGGEWVGDFLVTRSSPTTLTIGAQCTAQNPCHVRFGNRAYAFASASTVSLVSGTGTAYIYAAPAGQIVVGHAMNLTCSGGCVVQPGTTSFPADSIPLFAWAAINGAWAEAGGTDWRAWLSAKAVTGGFGTLSQESEGVTQVAVNPAVVSTYTNGTTAPPSTCTPGERYLRTDTNQAYDCTSSNTWTEVTGGGGGGGEANTASNVGTAGTGVFDAKAGVDLQFRKLNPLSSRIGIGLDAANRKIDFEVNEGNIAHQNLSGAGTNTHAQIDTHLGATSAHGTSGSVVGTTDTQTLSNKTLTTPTIGSFANAAHNHANAAGGGQLTDAALSAAVGLAKGGTNNATWTAGRCVQVAGDGSKLESASGACGGGGLGDPGSDGVVYRSGLNTTRAATANDLSGPNFCMDAGSSDSYACDLSPAITGYLTGALYRFKANTANSGQASINLNSLGAKTIKKVRAGLTSDLVDNDIPAGQWVEVIYDGTNMQMISAARAVMSEERYLPAAAYDGNAASTRAAWNTASSPYVPAPTVIGANPYRLGVLQFGAADEDYGIFDVLLPATWDAGPVAVKVFWLTPSTETANAVIRIETVCIAAGEDITAPTFNAAQSQTAATTTANLLQTTTWSATTTGCAAGEPMRVRFGRNGPHASDTYSGSLNVVAAAVTYSRYIQ
jgi:hypothetical protein